MWTMIKNGFKLIGQTVVRHPIASFIFAWAISETAYPGSRQKEDGFSINIGPSKQKKEVAIDGGYCCEESQEKAEHEGED